MVTPQRGRIPAEAGNIGVWLEIELPLQAREQLLRWRCLCLLWGPWGPWKKKLLIEQQHTCGSAPATFQLSVDTPGAQGKNIPGAPPHVRV